MKEFRAKFIGEDGREQCKEFDTMEEAQEFYDSHLEVAIQRLNPETGVYEDVLWPTYEF